MKIVECVPNFSEGRDKQKIEAIAEAVRSVAGVALFDVDAGAATNRTVYTFAGAPEAVLEAAYRSIKKGSEIIDMRAHKGEHARAGACDVCPFVPVAGVTMDECVELAKVLGKRVGDELQIPVYLYAEAAVVSSRKKLPDIRAGEYEALQEKLKRPEWKPDFGPAKFNAKAGATTIGARNFLIAYNVNLNTKSVRLAKDIAFAIRETGRLKRDSKGDKVIGSDGNPEREAGFFKDVQATGWLIPEYNRAQVTINILNIDKSPLHLVFDKCRELAQKLGLRVTGSEIVGMVPERVLREAGIYFLKKQGATTGVSKRETIGTAVTSLGLTDVAPFDPDKKIIERRFMKKRPLASMTNTSFIEETASNSPTPGGGSVAALAGALSGALTSMVAALTFEKRGFENVKDEMERIGVTAQEIIEKQVNAIDDDTEAFNKVMEGMRLPKNTDDEKKKREAAIFETTKKATLEPFGTLERMKEASLVALAVSKCGNPNSLSDAGVAGLMAVAAAKGAYYNVLINLPGITDKKWCEDIKERSKKLLATIEQTGEEVEKIMKTALSS